MTKVAGLQEKVEKAKVKVEKCKGTIARHEKQLQKKIEAVIKSVGLDLTGKSKEEIDELRDPYRGTDHSWTIYEVISKLDDINGANKKLAEAEHILGNWEEKLNSELEKDDFISNQIPQVIKDFLEQWKLMAFEWHIKRYDAYQDFKKKIAKEVEEAYIKLGIKESMMPSRSQREELKEMNLDWESIKSRKVNFAGSVILYMDGIRKETERLAWLEKTLEQDKRAKMIDLINRVTNVTGTITDASYLAISDAGNLNGHVTGEKGKAKVETITAGGWNIQCWHYRTLVHKI